MKKYENTYGIDYYKTYDTADYGCQEIWMKHFRVAAKKIVDTYHPKYTLDIGCAYGYLVAALRDLGVEAYGIDVSEFAISQVRDDIKPFCAACNAVEGIPENFPQHFDLITNIEMIEHLYEEDADKFIGVMCSVSDRIVLSSTDSDYDDPTHVNVQKQEYWAKRFASHGYVRNLIASNLEISANTMVFEKSDSSLPGVVESYERTLRLFKNTMENESMRVEKVIDGKDSYIQGLQQQIAEQEQAAKEITESKDSYIQGLQQQIAEQEQQSKELAESKDSYIQGLQQQIAEQEQQSKELAESKDSYIQGLQQQIAEKENKLRNQIYEAEQQKEALRQEKENWVALACERLNILREVQAAQQIKQDEYNHLTNLFADLSVGYDELINSIYWKITFPIRWAASIVKKILKKLPIIHRAWPYLRVWQRQGFHAMMQYRQDVKNHTIAQPLQVAPPAEIASAPAAPAEIANVPAVTCSIPPITGHPIDPIEVVYTGENCKRINLVTDSLNADSLLGGTATALVCASKLAKAYGYELRIITRNADVNPVGYWNNLKISGIDTPEKVSFYSDYWRHNPNPAPYKLELGTNEVFFATSWWSVKAIRATAPQCHLIYIIQEIETFFYNYGGEHLLCSQVMKDPNIDFIVNSHYLNDYFKKEQPNIVEHGCWFEPAFPKNLYQRGSFEQKEKYKLFFYARPNNPRNLFTIGVQMLDKAISEGILDTDEWDVYCIGQAAPELTFSNGAKSINLGQLSWEEYAKFLADVDIGLCLMYTPHPSYPPYDVACSGGVVLTNKMLNKTSFEACGNIIMADLTDDEMMDGFREAIQLAKDTERRKQNFENSRICRDWNESMEPVISFMKGKL